MNKIVKFLSGVTGAGCGYVLLKFISSTGLTFELASFLLTCLIVTLIMDSTMRGCRNKL